MLFKVDNSVNEMALSREIFYGIIYYNFYRGLFLDKCHEEHISIYNMEVPSQTIIYRWYWEFRRGRASIATVTSTGRPKTAVTLENIAAGQKIIQDDRHVTYEQIRTLLGIRMTAIQIILHCELDVRKLVSRWLPQNLPEDQKGAHVDWCRSAQKRFDGGKSKSMYNIVLGDES